jgi:hypothetical protein
MVFLQRFKTKANSYLYLLFPKAGAGLVITEGTIISEQGMGWAWAARIYEPEHVEGWKKVTQAVHKADGKIFCQLWHMGRVTHSSFHGLQPLGPSAVLAGGEGTTGKDLKKHPYEVPREATVDDIKRSVEEYRHAAQCAKEAGFDGVEIHSANGYFIDIFLSVRNHSPSVIKFFQYVLHSTSIIDLQRLIIICFLSYRVRQISAQMTTEDQSRINTDFSKKLLLLWQLYSPQVVLVYVWLLMEYSWTWVMPTIMRHSLT